MHRSPAQGTADRPPTKRRARPRSHGRPDPVSRGGTPAASGQPHHHPYTPVVAHEFGFFLVEPPVRNW
ncbi:unnamed protein product [Boreogadus saida]